VLFEFPRPAYRSGLLQIRHYVPGHYSGIESTFRALPVSATSFAIIDEAGARRSYKVKMDNQNGELLRLTPKERDAGATVLGRAFTEYELFRYYFHDDTERRAAADRLSFVELSVCLKYGEVYTSSEKLEGVAAWLPPGKAPFGARQIMRSVPLSTLVRFGRQGASRMRAYGRFVDDLHRRLVPYPHWYLQIIGVGPAYQGQGFSSRLLRPVLECIDRERMPCYLETNSGKNVAIYRRFGFEVVSEDKMPGTELTIFAMFRKSQTA
jgi:ribosomal protein S18 acetylase RimI-like enzyme